MTRVDFYVLGEDHTDEARLRFTCRLVQKAFRAGSRVLVNSADPEQAAALDDLLWQVPAGGFVPHGRLGADAERGAPVAIGCGDDPEHHHDVLVNLAADVPPYFSRFERLAEIVHQDDTLLAASRSRWAFYRDRGYPLEHHAIGAWQDA